MSGAFNGVGVTAFGISPLITTLATNGIVTGLSLAY